MTPVAADTSARYRFFVTDETGLVARLQRAAYQDSGLRPWSTAAIGRQLAAPSSSAIICERRDPQARRRGAIGFALVQIVPPESEVLALGIVPGHRGNGAGRALLAEIENRARAAGCGKIFLDVGAGNTAARGLYEGAGFDLVERRLGYYSGSGGGAEDALVLVRQIEN